MILAHVELQRAGGWPPAALKQVRRANRKYPLYMHARIIKLQGEIALTRYRPCLLHKQLEETAALCPENRWITRSLAVTRRALRGTRGREILGQ